MESEKPPLKVIALGRVWSLRLDIPLFAEVRQ
jgi:hypothetical protein